jgi:phosphoglycerate dehydrogenase-like enzyme
MRVAVLDDYQRVARELGPWDALEPDVEVDFLSDHVADDDTLIARLEPYEAVVAIRERTPFGRARLERLPKLRLLVTTGMGNTSIDVAAAAEQHPACELGPDRVLPAARAQRAVLGIAGLGRLGARVAAIARAFEMEVIAWSQNLRPERAAEVGAEAVAREELFARADVLTIHLKLSDRTRGLIGAADLARLKPTAYLVNTSRGPIVDEAALLDALHGGRIAGAALDVYDVEPLPPDHPLRAAPNTALTRTSAT